jgi:putative transposase
MIRSERRWSSAKVIEALADVMVMKGVPEHLRSDNGPEFVARDLRKWLAGTGARTAYIEQEAQGRTATVKASTRSCETSS